MKEKFYYKCVDCGAEYSGEEIIYLCPACAAGNKPCLPPLGVLKTIYHYEQIRKNYATGDLFSNLTRENLLPLLPLKNMSSWPALKVGNTPGYWWTGGQVDGWTGGQVLLKDDSQNPTFSFKDRASALVSAWAKEHGISRLVAASTGNAGSSLAGICAAQHQQATIVVPAAAPLAKLTQILMYGATLIPVKGTYDDAFNLSVEISARYGHYNRNTAFNPLTIEGKKTVAFELYQDLGYRLPDRVFIPVGDGVIYSGVCKGFEDLLKLGITDRIPVLVAVQSAGSSNLVDNLHREVFSSRPSDTIADSISVDVPRCFNLTADNIRQYGGEAITVSDDEIRQASLLLARTSGIFSEPAAVAAFAGLLKHAAEERINREETNVVLLTGSGLKDLKAVQSSIRIPEPVDPDIRAVSTFLDTMS